MTIKAYSKDNKNIQRPQMYRNMNPADQSITGRSSKDISVVISLLNEKESLPELVSWIRKVMKDNGFSYEIIMVDDGSNDGSWEIIKELASAGHGLTSAGHEKVQTERDKVQGENDKAQAGRDIPCYGTTHADYIYGEIPCVRNLTKEEIEEAYEKNTGVLIADEFERMQKDYIAVPAVLCKNHGVFTWGKDAHEAVHNAVVVEEVAKMAARCELINPQVQPAPQELQDKHYYRKHGENAYYGQPGRS